MKKITYKTIVCVAIFIVIGMTVFPPFTATTGNDSLRYTAYHFLFDPPSLAHQVNAILLSVQVMIVSLMAAAVCFLKSQEK